MVNTFIQLTDTLEDGSPFYIDTKSIIAISAFYDGSLIDTEGSHRYYVREKPEEIIKLIT